MINEKQINPLISIVVPVFNVEDYINDALKSMLNQTYKNIEIIVVDDASTDKTYDILNGFKDDRVKILRNKKNSGICHSLNKALSIAKGEYIARADGDDILLPDRISQQLAYLKENPDIGIVGCSLTTIDENNNEIGQVKYTDNQVSIKKVLKFSSPVAHIWLCKTSVYKTVGEYHYDGAEDLYFIQRAHAVNIKISNIPNYFGMKIRVRSGNTTSTKGLEQRLLHKFVVEQAKHNTQHEFCMPKIYIRKKLYNLSFNLTQKAVKTKNKPYAFLCYVISAFISPDQCYYLINRSRKKWHLSK
ncbi:glycosyltransferase family 2 protein [Aeromonas hydrophila]|uniref:glycosyltransferase family 2 protein n=1 Tax=Aeromonas hydrophila TaxID=644 RepID=UPI003D2053CF